MSAPVIEQPDAEALVYGALRELAGVDSFTYSANQIWPGWIMAHFVQVDARAKRKEAARQLAERARQIMTALPDRPWADGTVCYVQGVEGPFWLPDPDGSPRYTARYEVRVHPRRDRAPALVNAP